MSAKRTPPLSLQGSREVLEEMSRPPRETPERRRLMKRVSVIEESRERQMRRELLRQAYREAANDPVFMAEMADIARAFDCTAGDGFE